MMEQRISSSCRHVDSHFGGGLIEVLPTRRCVRDRRGRSCQA